MYLQQKWKINNDFIFQKYILAEKMDKYDECEKLEKIMSPFFHIKIDISLPRFAVRHKRHISFEF